MAQVKARLSLVRPLPHTWPNLGAMPALSKTTTCIAFAVVVALGILVVHRSVAFTTPRGVARLVATTQVSRADVPAPAEAPSSLAPPSSGASDQVLLLVFGALSLLAVGGATSRKAQRGAQ